VHLKQLVTKEAITFFESESSRCHAQINLFENKEQLFLEKREQLMNYPLTYVK